MTDSTVLTRYSLFDGGLFDTSVACVLLNERVLLAIRGSFVVSRGVQASYLAVSVAVWGIFFTMLFPCGVQLPVVCIVCVFCVCMCYLSYQVSTVLVTLQICVWSSTADNENAELQLCWSGHFLRLRATVVDARSLGD